MDSLSQFVLGAAVGLAVSPVKNRKIAILGGLLATVPDLDIVLNYDNELTTFVNHRSFSHSLFVLFAVSFPIAYGLKKWLKNSALNYWQWLVFSLITLITHPLLDSLTIFGTQLFWPLGVSSVMIGSMFIIDPLYTLPLLISFLVLMKKKHPPKVLNLSLNTIALGLSTAYLGLSLILQQYVALNQPYPEGVSLQRPKFVMPTPMNLIIWKTVVRTEDKLHEGFYHLFKGISTWRSLPHQQNKFNLTDNKSVKKYAHFSHNFYRLNDKNDKLIISDVRMGTIQMPIFSFHIANKVGQQWQAIPPQPHTDGFFGFKEMFGGQTLF